MHLESVPTLLYVEVLDEHLLPHINFQLRQDVDRHCGGRERHVMHCDARANIELIATPVEL